MSASATRATPDITTSCGLSFIPGVSSSKKRRRPALAAGIGASSLLLFSRLLNRLSLLCVLGPIVSNKAGVEDYRSCMYS